MNERKEKMRKKEKTTHFLVKLLEPLHLLLFISASISHDITLFLNDRLHCSIFVILARPLT